MRCKPYSRQPFKKRGAESVQQVPSSTLDAIFVPTCRTESAFVRQLEQLASLADILCILPTGPASETFQSTKAFPRNLRIIPSETIATIHRHFLQRASSQNPSLIVTPDYDLPAKRNLALHLARSCGLQRICLLDDDITISPEQVRAATGALSEDVPMAGFYVFDFPDVSTIDHIHRMVTNTPSETLPGGNCLFTLVNRVEGFFPYIYNEDWIFVLHNSTSRTGFVAGDVKQEAHTPWQNHNRVKFEEFGEAVISGLLPLPNVINAPEALSVDYWASVCTERQEWLTALCEACEDAALRQTTRVALESLGLFFPRDFVQFIRAFKTDLNDYLWLPPTTKLL